MQIEIYSRGFISSFCSTVYFALMASDLTRHIPVICPSALLLSTHPFPMNLSMHALGKVAQRQGPRSVCPAGSLSIHLCLCAVMTQFDNPVEFTLPKLNASAHFKETGRRIIICRTGYIQTLCSSTPLVVDNCDTNDYSINIASP